MHPEPHSDLDNLKTVQHNLRNSAKGSNDANDVTVSLTQTPVEIDEARTMSRELPNHRVQELSNIHGQEWSLARDGSFESKTNDLAGWSLFVQSPSGICWLFCAATETERNVEGWHGEENHTNNTGELKTMLAPHVFVQYLQEVTCWQEARHEAPIQRLRDAQNVTVTGHEWSNSLPNPRIQELCDFNLRALIEQSWRALDRKKLNCRSKHEETHCVRFRDCWFCSDGHQTGALRVLF